MRSVRQEEVARLPAAGLRSFYDHMLSWPDPYGPMPGVPFRILRLD